MKIKDFGIFFLGVLFCCTAADAQVGLQVNQEPWLLKTTEQAKKINSPIQSFAKSTAAFSIPSTMALRSPVQFTPQTELGFFCQLDANMDSKLPYRLRFRLGEYHYVQRLEGYYD